MRTALICHEGSRLSREGIARWLASFSELAGILVIREPRGSRWARVRRELRRSGPVGILDAAAFRLYYRVFLAAADRRAEEIRLDALRQRYPPVSPGVPVHVTSSPNSPDAVAFLTEQAPDLVIARCKSLLQERVFSIPRLGTFVLHPGICPEYRNSHGCFWALAEGEPEKVGATLLRIDRGVDTGPVFAYYTAPFDARRDSHVEIQARVVFDNLPAIAEKLGAIAAGTAVPIDTGGRRSAAWGQPRLSAYWRWRRHARAGAA